MDHLAPIHWSAPEYAMKEKSADWFWALGIIAISLAIIALLFHDALFAIFILLGAGTLALYAFKEPRVVSFTINDRGILIDAILYPYSTLESFGIDEIGAPKLLVKSKKITMPFIVIPLEEDLVERTRDYLLDYLDEQEHLESFSHKLMEYLGF